MGSSVQFPCFLPELLWSFNCPKTRIFCNCADLSKILVIKTSKMLTRKKFNKILQLKTQYLPNHTFFRRFKDHNSGTEQVNQRNDLLFLSTFSALFVTFISEFENPHFHILVCNIPKFLAKCQRSGQLIILFQKIDMLRLLKICIMFCPPAGAKYLFFQVPAHGLYSVFCGNTNGILR